MVTMKRFLAFIAFMAIITACGSRGSSTKKDVSTPLSGDISEANIKNKQFEWLENPTKTMLIGRWVTDDVNQRCQELIFSSTGVRIVQKNPDWEDKYELFDYHLNDYGSQSGIIYLSYKEEADKLFIKEEGGTPEGSIGGMDAGEYKMDKSECFLVDGFDENVRYYKEPLKTTSRTNKQKSAETIEVKQKSNWTRNFDENNVLVLDTQTHLTREGENEYYMFLHAAPYSEDKTEGKITMSHWKKKSNGKSSLTPHIAGDYRYHNGTLYITHCKAYLFAGWADGMRWGPLEKTDETTLSVNESTLSVSGPMIYVRVGMSNRYVETMTEITAVKSDFNYRPWLNNSAHSVY